MTLPVNPVPTPRPRVSKWGTYYPKTYKDWLKAVESHLKRGDLGLEPDAELLVVIEQVGKKPKTTKRLFPRGDVDNHAKGPMDVITRVGGYWDDDDQITHLMVTKRYAEPGEEPHTHVEIYTP